MIKLAKLCKLLEQQPDMVFNRITIVGNSASGKSTLAEAVGKSQSLPVFHIDLLLWEPNWEFKNEAEFDRAHADWLNRERWIIEGVGYHSVLLKRFAAIASESSQLSVSAEYER